MQKIRSLDRDNQDEFGWDLSISEDYFAIGARSEDSDSAGGNILFNSGSAYIFNKDTAGQWVQSYKLTANDRQVTSFFGHTIKISDSFLIVGAPQKDELDSNNVKIMDCGAAYIFQLDSNNNWVFDSKVLAHDKTAHDRYGNSVSIDGRTALVGCEQSQFDTNYNNQLYRAGAAYLYQKSNGSWINKMKIVPNGRAKEDYFGRALNVNRNNFMIGSPRDDEDENDSNYLVSSGSVYAYKGIAPELDTAVKIVVSCDSYTWSSNSITYYNSGIYIDTLKGQNGKDSFAAINLMINKTSIVNLVLEGCDSLVSPSAKYTWKTSGLYTDTLTNQFGCDSILNINLTIATRSTKRDSWNFLSKIVQKKTK